MNSRTEGVRIRLDEIEYTGEHEKAYNLQAEGFHTYFVGCQEWGFSVWARNADFFDHFRIEKGKYGIKDPNGQPIPNLDYKTIRQAQTVAKQLSEGTLFRNHYPTMIGRELAKAADLGVTPAKITGPASVRASGQDGRVFKWVVSRDGELLGLPKLGQGDAFRGQAITGRDVIKHAVATSGRPVQAAGNARIQGDKILIDRRSGHFRPNEASIEAAKRKFKAVGFKVEIVESVDPPS